MTLLKYGALVLTMLLLAAPPAMAEKAGEVISVIGSPQIRSGRTGQWIQLGLNDPVSVGDRIRTGASRVKLLLVDDTVLTLDRHTEMKISRHLFKPKEQERSGLFDLFSGKVKALVGRFFGNSDVRIQTPTAVAGVRGTYFMVEVNEGDGDTRVTVFNGEVLLSNDNGSVNLTRAMTAVLGKAGIVDQPRNLPLQDLMHLEKSMDIRSKSAAKERTTKLARTFRARVGDFSGSMGSFEGLGRIRGSLRSPPPRPGGTIPPANLESFEPSRGSGSVTILWPEEK